MPPSPPSLYTCGRTSRGGLIDGKQCQHALVCECSTYSMHNSAAQSRKVCDIALKKLRSRAARLWALLTQGEIALEPQRARFRDLSPRLESEREWEARRGGEEPPHHHLGAGRQAGAGAADGALHFTATALWQQAAAFTAWPWAAAHGGGAD